MPSIFISGIPKGIDRGAVSLRIRKDIETVAQVDTIWIPKEKDYCFVSLHDETSADFVLSLNEKICINGNSLRITRWRRKVCVPEIPRRTTVPTCTKHTNNDLFVLRGYDTYTDYRSQRPQSDALYQYIQKTPKQKRLKRKPWKDINRGSQLSSPKSRKNVRSKRQKCKKKNTRHTKKKVHSQSSSQLEVGLHLDYKRQKRSKFKSGNGNDSANNIPTCFNRNASPSKNTLQSTGRTDIGKKALDLTQPYATVHVYDHSTRLCSIDVDNNNVLESIQTGLNNKQLPSDDTILISHNGKIVTSQWQPTMANDDNIHIIVKGKGGMMQGDLPSGAEHNADDKAEKKKNDSSRGGIPNKDVREPDAEISLNESEQKQHVQANVTSMKPTGDNGKTGTDDNQPSADDKNPVEDAQKNRLLLKQVIQSSPFVSTLSQGSEVDQASLIQELDLGDCFPDKLTDASVMSISKNERDEADTLADIPRLIIRKLIMLDFTSREDDLNECLAKLNKRKEEPLVESQKSNSPVHNENFLSLFDDEDTVEKSFSCLENPNPVDVFLSIFICLHPTLKEKVCLKMFACRLAIPIIFPVEKDERHGKTLMFSMRPLRSITVHNGPTDTSLINCKQNVVSFVRLERPHISKSKLANEILYGTSHNAFFNYDCKLGSSDKKASVGLVEAAWFVPSPKQPRSIRTVSIFLNLRGNAFQNAEQMEYLKRVSRVMVIVTDKETMKNKKDMEYFKRANFNVLFLLTGNVSKDFTQKYKQFFMESSPEGFNAEFIPGSKNGRSIGLSEIKETILNVIGALLDNTSYAKTTHEMCQEAKSIGINVDEDMPSYKKGKLHANAIFNKVKDYPLPSIKLKFTPLQKTYWQEFTWAMKMFRKQGSDLKEKESLKQKMDLQRTQQWTVYDKAENSFMKDFITIFLTLDGDSLVSFLDLLKFELDENSRNKMPFFRKNYAEAWDKFQSKTQTEKAQSKKDVSTAEKQLSEASFGIEHIFRELGQIYEASLMAKESKLGPKLAKAVARSIKQGYPFELMDGDVASVPLKWVERIFEELKHILGDVRLLTLSILGLQSSGKSTLLNAMFGLTFSVSAGRCTRGIYIQLFPVQKENFNFDYVLVVDTEGLRAPELGEQKAQHDNELATLVLGMADITIVNIKGENTSEVKDILQICVHAFLRLKMANESLQLRQSCIFIHQNVSDVGAKDSMIHARKKLDETLDKMALEAAEEENISDIKCFKDVIEFDSNKHVWYFSDLWKGDPPMAPANPGYSRDVREVKSFIFKTLANHKRSYLSISDTFTHIKDLWHGILANDFVFSFRNTLEIEAYNALDKVFQDLIWSLERYTKELTDKAEGEMEQCTADVEKVKDSGRSMPHHTDRIHRRYLNEYREKETQLKADLEKYFEDSNKRDAITKWKHSKLCSWDALVEEKCGNLKRQLSDIETNCKVEYEINTSHEKLKKEIYDQATNLAEQKKGSRPSTKDMETEFNEMWDKWIKNLDVQEKESTEIKVLLESILFDIFQKHKDILKTELNMHTLDSCVSFHTLEGSLNKFRFNDNYISIKKRSLGKLVKDTLTGTSTIDSETTDEVVRFTNIIFKDVDARLRDLKSKEWKVDVTEMKEIAKCILEHIDRQKPDSKNKFTFLQPYKVKLCVHVFRMALPLLEKLDSDYRKKNGIKAKLNKQKAIVWCHFQDIVDEKSATIIACDRFCEIVREKVEEKVKKIIPHSIFEDIVCAFGNAKHIFITCIMEDLAHKQNSKLFLEYIEDPFSYALLWLCTFIDDKCFGESSHLYMDTAWKDLQHRFEVIINSVKKTSASCLHDWLTNVQSEIKDTVWIPFESFSVVENQNVTDLNDFTTTVANKLGNLHTELRNIFQSVTAKAVVWITPATPLQLALEKLWGCKAICPFCHEPCQWNESHVGKHLCVQHRTEGVNGRNWKDTRKIAVESCSFDVQSTFSFQCSSMCRGICKKRGESDVFHPYNDYKDYFPEWNIAPCPDISSSKYWAWVLCTFNEEFAKYYNTEKADIPVSWKKITKDDAIESLRELRATYSP